MFFFVDRRLPTMGPASPTTDHRLWGGDYGWPTADRRSCGLWPGHRPSVIARVAPEGLPGYNNAARLDVSPRMGCPVPKHEACSGGLIVGGRHGCDLRSIVYGRAGGPMVGGRSRAVSRPKFQRAFL